MNLINRFTKGEEGSDNCTGARSEDEVELLMTGISATGAACRQPVRQLRVRLPYDREGEGLYFPLVPEAVNRFWDDRFWRFSAQS